MARRKRWVLLRVLHLGKVVVPPFIALGPWTFSNFTFSAKRG
jgi:hypothetical protein